jgi:hypothetical protein
MLLQGSMFSRSTGITGSYNEDPLAIKVITAFFAGLAMYNALELLVIVFLTFSRYSGVYFWSLLVASWGIIPFSLGILIKYFNLIPGNTWVSELLLTIGWWTMVTGQSVVLWSRLHLMLTGTRGTRILTWTKWIIIIDAIILHIPNSTLNTGSNGIFGPNIKPFLDGFNIYEKVQMCGFFAQETLLSTIYIIAAVRILKTSLRPGTRNILYQLFAINVIIIVLDIALLSCEFANLYIIETTFKGVVYSIKLKLEFAVLGKLVQFVCWNGNGSMKRRRSSVWTDDENDVFGGMPGFVIPSSGLEGSDTAPRLLRHVSLSARVGIDFKEPAFGDLAGTDAGDREGVVAVAARIYTEDAESRLYRHYEEAATRTLVV